MPKIVDKDRMKSEIAKAALSILSLKGFEKTTIQEIADAAGIGKGTIYQYFATKEEILIQVSMELFNEFQDLIRKSFISHSDPKERIYALIDETISFFDNTTDINMVYLELWLISLRENIYGVPMLILQDLLVETRKIIAGIIDEGKMGGVFRKDADSESLAISLVASLDGLGLHYLFDKSSFNLKTVSDEFLRSFFYGLIDDGRDAANN